MADVTGPINSLPGSVRRVPEGMNCDNGCGRKAEVRVQGETDLFGSEMIDLCRPCADQEREINRKAREHGFCDWCSKDNVAVSVMRDIDEGMCGPVYHVCAGCRGPYDEAIRRELEAYGDV